MWLIPLVSSSPTSRSRANQSHRLSLIPTQTQAKLKTPLAHEDDKKGKRGSWDPCLPWPFPPDVDVVVELKKRIVGRGRFSSRGRRLTRKGEITGIGKIR